MIIPFTLLFGALGYLNYKSKDEVTSFLETDELEATNEKSEDDDLYKNLEDLFI